MFKRERTIVSWMLRLQKSIMLSIIEIEYMIVLGADNKMIWLKNFLKKLEKVQTSRTLFWDNQSPIHLAKNLVFHARMKVHITVVRAL